MVVVSARVWYSFHEHPFRDWDDIKIRNVHETHEGMYLQKLEMQGFKSFAEKTTFLFPGYSNDCYGITAVIGPNGSGKSNVADGIRWVLGEQSLKLLRSKRAEDVIFFGSTQKAQKGFCEVALYFNNEDHAFPIDFPEVVITRRLYRDGTSEYLLNKNKVRLSDIALSLAQAHIGQRSYSVIGQGMVDAILQTVPSDRKEFFNEAVGVRQYQIKRDSAVSKLKSTNENLTHALTILSELEPKMRFFARQLKRLEERSEVERDYITIQQQYTNVLWNDLSERKEAFENERDMYREKSDAMEQQQRMIEETFIQSEQAVSSPARSSFHTLSQNLQELQKEKQQIVTRLSVVDSRLQTELVASGKGQLAWLTGRCDELAALMKSIDEEMSSSSEELSALRASEEHITTRIREHDRDAATRHDVDGFERCVQEVETLAHEASSAESVDALKYALDTIASRLKNIKETARHLIAWVLSGGQSDDTGRARLLEEFQSIRIQQEVCAARIALRSDERTRTARELEQTSRELSYVSQSDLSDQHACARAEKEKLAVQRERLKETIAVVQKELDGLYETERETHRVLLDLQKQMSVLSKEHDIVRDAMNRAHLEIAKLEAHQEELLAKICDELRVDESTRAELIAGTETVYSVLGFLKETPHLDRDEARIQIERLRRKLEQIGTIDQDVIAEHEEAKGRYEFLHAQVTDLTEAKASLESAIAELDTIIRERFEKNLEGISKKFGTYFAQLFGGGTARLVVLRKEKKKGEADEEGDEEETEEVDDAIAGIEIEATPPGKKFKSLSFLSGGEKALTAIALLCAILAQNPSPFVVLDEVDAALDESNANRFASIIKDLSPHTQFILITHNRVTIHIAHVLYGVTMAAGGVSSVLSLDMEKIDGIVTT